MFTTVMFVFAALIEFAIVNVLARQQRHHAAESERHKEEVEEVIKRRLEDRGFGNVGDKLLVR